jgi:CRP-like cAMP-binding protein
MASEIPTRTRPTLVSSNDHQGNRLLGALEPDDFALLAPHLELIDLPRLKKLELPSRRIEHAYFFGSGIASIVSVQAAASVEVGIIGCEGMTGGPIINGNSHSPYQAYMQVAGAGHRIAAEHLTGAFGQSRSLHAMCLRFNQTFLIQATQTAVSNARATIEERLARWLLMAHDRVPSHQIPLTHEFLAMMMGAGRPGVTEAIHALASKGLIRGERGMVVMIDRDGLIERAGAYYGLPEREYERLLGSGEATALAANGH